MFPECFVTVFYCTAQGRTQELIDGVFSSLPSPSLPLELDPLNQLVGLGSAVSSHSGVRGRAPAENEFGAL